jgi:hypothetical protein
VLPALSMSSTGSTRSIGSMVSIASIKSIASTQPTPSTLQHATALPTALPRRATPAACRRRSLRRRAPTAA